MDYLNILISILGGVTSFVFVMLIAFTWISFSYNVRTELLKFFLFVFVLGFSFILSPIVLIPTIILFGIYYGRKIYKSLIRI